MKERYLLILLAVLLLGTIAAFFLYVPILPVLEVVVIVSGLACTFALGWAAGQESDGVTRMSQWMDRALAFLRLSKNHVAANRHRVWQTETRSHP